MCVFSHIWVPICEWQVRVNRDERRRFGAWPCIIHGADLAEESPGELCAIVVAADINNTASQGASLHWCGWG